MRSAFHQAAFFTVYYASAQGSNWAVQCIEQLASSISKDSSYGPNRKVKKCSLSIIHGTDELDMDEVGEISDAIFSMLLLDKNQIFFAPHLDNSFITNTLQLYLLLAFS